MVLSFHSYKEWNNLHLGKQYLPWLCYCLYRCTVYIMYFSLKNLYFPWLSKVTMENGSPSCSLNGLQFTALAGQCHRILPISLSPPQSPTIQTLDQSGPLKMVAAFLCSWFTQAAGHWSCSIYHKLRSLRVIITKADGESCQDERLLQGTALFPCLSAI